MCKEYVSPDYLGPTAQVRLVNTDGRGLTSVGLATMTVSLPGHQAFVVAECLSVPAIIRCDFLVRHDLIIEFEKGIYCSRKPLTKEDKLSLRVTNSCMLVLDEDHPVQYHISPYA